MKPKLSVVICTFNRGESLEKCLESLTKQSLTNFEVVIIDGGSTDETPKVISKYSKRLKVREVIDKSKELARVRDRGWREAQGELVAWIDDDVVVSRNWVKSIVAIFDKHKDVAGVSGPTIVKKELLKNRDVFSLYERESCHSDPERSRRGRIPTACPPVAYAPSVGRRGSFPADWRVRMTLIRCVGKFWNNFFLEGGKYEVGRIFKSGAWSPGSNFPRSLKIKGLGDVDYLEACNTTLRKNLIAKVGGFDYGYTKVAEWSELDLAMRIKELGYRLVFSSKVRVDHNISQKGVYPRRTAAKQRMENFLKFYFRHIFKFRSDYIFKFLTYLLFLNFYWGYKAVTTKNIDWLGGWRGTISGLKLPELREKSKTKTLNSRYEANKTAKFQRTETRLFLNLLDKKYDQVLEVGCGKGFFSYVGALNKKFINCYGCDVFEDYRIKEIEEYAESAIYKQIEGGNLPFADNSFDLVFSADVIEHTSDDIKFIKESIRVCKKGGQVIIGTPNYWRITNIPLMALGKLKYPRNMGKDTYGDCIHIREYKMEELVEKLIKVSNGRLNRDDIEVYPCWFGILSLNLGFKKFPDFLKGLCHFFFIKFNKTWR